MTQQPEDSPQRTFESAKACWEVTAGLIPGTPEPTFTKRWVFTSSDNESAERSDIFMARMALATEYMQQLQQPQRLNWVRLDWIWF